MLDWSDQPSTIGLAIFTVAWCAGWLGFLRAKQLPQATRFEREAVSVIIPCRNEVANLPTLLTSLRSVLRETDEVIVVDDDSCDGTAHVATQGGATVIHLDSLPSGWAGKSHACWQGVQHASRNVVVFIDADVRVGPRGVDDLVAKVAEHPDALVSAMPWHRTGSPVERFSMLFNVISSLVGSMQTRNARRRVAYGPFMAVRKDVYAESAGHSHDLVRAAVVEDLALARVMPESLAYLARPDQVEYRMYREGWKQLVEGWTKNTAIGAVSVPRWSAVIIIAWVASLCGGVLTSPWMYVASVVQVWVLARRIGNFGAVSALLYPLHATVFACVAIRSLVRSAVVGRVTWRGRTIATR